MKDGEGRREGCSVVGLLMTCFHDMFVRGLAWRLRLTFTCSRGISIAIKGSVLLSDVNNFRANTACHRERTNEARKIWEGVCRPKWKSTKRGRSGRMR